MIGRRCKRALAATEQELAAVRHDLERTGHLLQMKTAENRGLQAECAALVHELQTVRAQLQAERQEREALAYRLRNALCTAGRARRRLGRCKARVAELEGVPGQA